MKEGLRLQKCGFFRRLLRVSWTERRTNESVLLEMGTERMLLAMIKERRLKYIGHAQRNRKTDLMKTVFEGKTKSKRKRGRPSVSYVDQVSRSSGLRLQGISQDRENRDEWRKFVRTTCAAATIETDDADR